MQGRYVPRCWEGAFPASIMSVPAIDGPPCGDEPRVPDRGDDLLFGHPEGDARGGDHVLLHHRAAEVVRAEEEPDLRHLRPIVTHDTWTVGTFGNRIRDSASTPQVPNGVAESPGRRLPEPRVARQLGVPRLEHQGMNAVKPPVSSWSARTRSRCATIASGVSMLPNIIVAVDRSPCRWASTSPPPTAPSDLLRADPAPHLIVEDLRPAAGSNRGRSPSGPRSPP